MHKIILDIIILIFLLFFIYITSKIVYHSPRSHYYYIKGQVNGTYFNYINNYFFSPNEDYLNIFSYKEFKSHSYSYKIVNMINKNDLIFKLYKKICLIKNNNTTKEINYIQSCKNSKVLNESNIEIITDKNNSKYYNLYFWKQNRIFINSTRYYFYQGINSKGKCDKKLKFKSCGYLTDLKCEFCIKDNDICPLLYKKDTNLNNLTLNSFLTNINIFFNSTFNENLFRNGLNIKYENNFNDLNIIDKYNANNFFRDNGLYEPLSYIYNDEELQSIDVYLIKDNSIKIGKQEKISDLYIQKNLFSYIYISKDQIIIGVHFSYIIFMLIYYFIFCVVIDFDEYKSFIDVIIIYALLLFASFVYDKIYKYIFSYIIPEIYFLDLKNYKIEVIDGNYKIYKNQIKFLKIIVLACPYFPLILYSINFFVEFNKKQKSLNNVVNEEIQTLKAN